MRISDFRVVNYKAFGDSGLVQLNAGINIITGRNNVGKTALLQALAMDFSWSGHISPSTMVGGVGKFPKPTKLDFTLVVSKPELEELIGSATRLRFSYRRTLLHHHRNDPASIVLMKSIWEGLVSQSELAFKLRRTVSQQQTTLQAVSNPSHGQFVGPDSQDHVTIIRDLYADGSEGFRVSYEDELFDLGQELAPELLKRIYRFSAERFSLGDGDFGNSRVLQRDASNLAEVLHNLQANAAKFQAYMERVRYVFPQIPWISVEAGTKARLSTKVWQTHRDTMRSDLAISLTESGTGLGQVLAMLYVVVNAEAPQVLLIDEPQSFLHPGAVRKLIEVFADYPQHQYVISTHSSSVISAANPKEILLLRQASDGTSIQVADAKQQESIRAFFLETGTRLSDVFGMDEIIWVEGPTEEKVIPAVLRHYRVHHQGCAILPIRNTGDLEGRYARRIFEIYNSLSSAGLIFPSSVLFVLDSELRSEQEKKEIQRLSGHRTKFLPARMIENYCLNSRAIAAVMNATEGFSEALITEEKVLTLLTKKLSDAAYFKPRPVPAAGEEARCWVDAASVLRDLFSELSETRVTFQKTMHTVALVNWILEHDSASMTDLTSFVQGLVSSRIPV